MIIVGIDEVGRGCWAGPLVAGAVLLADNFEAPLHATWRLGDSKALTKRQREAAVLGLQELGVVSGLGWVSAQEVDELGLTQAVSLAMRRALEAIDRAGQSYDQIIIDGSFNFLPELPNARTLIKADSIIPAVGAASIIAKVARDNWMSQAALTYPGYGFEQHVGYGTSQHSQALVLLGPCDLHRRSFKPIQKILAVNTNSDYDTYH